MTKFNWHRARKAAVSGGLATGRAEHQSYMALVAKCAPLLRKMPANEIEHIAKDKARPAYWRAAAWRELKHRRIAVAKKPQAMQAQQQPNRPTSGPIYITDGTRPDGSLIVHTFATQAEAAAAGYPWARHDMTADPSTLTGR